MQQSFNPRKPVIGQVFGRLTALEILEKVGDNNAKIRCSCSCGGEKIASLICLRYGKTKSCGCLMREEQPARHGHSRKRGRRTPTYRSWCHMKERCLNPRCRDYPKWGGRGIKVCERWMKFENFLEDMGECPAGWSIEREDNNGNYCKENCKWIEHRLQGRNTRRVKHSIETARKVRELHSKRVKYKDIAAMLGMTYSSVRGIIRGHTWNE